MLNYTQLEALAAVIQTGSFDAAAQQLHVTQSAVSQRIKSLEEHIGTPLIKRGQPCEGTDTGHKLARHLSEVALLETRVTQTAPKAPHRLRIAVNADSLATWVLEALARHPDMQFEIVVDDQDHSAAWLERGEVSAVVTAKEKPPQGCDSISLGTMMYAPIASPEFVKKYFPMGVDNISLPKAPMLVFNNKDALQHIWIKQNFNIIHSGHVQQIPSTQGFIDAAILGMGWGLNPQSLVEPVLADGRVQRLVEGCDLPVPLFWQYPRLLKDGLSNLTESIVDISRYSME